MFIISAYLVGNETINCIVNGLIDSKIISIFFAEEIGQSLFNENQRSVNDRYRENESAPAFQFKRKEYSDLDVYGCIKCWQYQTCEYEGHEDAEGWKLTDKLLENFPSNYSDKEYAWGLD